MQSQVCICVYVIKTERKQIHCLSDILIAVASLDLKVPIIMKASIMRSSTVVCL